MSYALPLSPYPSLEQYKNLAQDLQGACESQDPAAIRQWAPQLERRWHDFQKSNASVPRCTLAGAQLFVAQAHGFASWPEFTNHVEQLGNDNSEVSNFESAVDAVVSGDAPKLRQLLEQNPQLARARSTREHRSTLLHYVSANGVEDFRQKTPANIVEITETLLDAGADVNAESDAYGGRSTTLGLTATSGHPEAAGLQIPLMTLLIERGAIIDVADSGSVVVACLHNGRGQAAEFLADRGARLDAEAAAGVGRLDILQGFFNSDGSLIPPATDQQVRDGLAWACEFGKTSVVEFLLHAGIKVDAQPAGSAASGLHWAAFAGRPDLVKLLLAHQAPVDAKDDRHDGTPLDWAIHGWGNSTNGAKPEPYYEAVALLVRAGAKLDPQWLEDAEDRFPMAAKVRSDPRMRTALLGELPI